MVQLFSHGVVELENQYGTRFKVNKQRIKAYMGTKEETKVMEVWADGEA